MAASAADSIWAGVDSVCCSCLADGQYLDKSGAIHGRAKV